MGEKVKQQVVGPDHAITRLAATLASNVQRLAASARLTPWEVLIAMANASAMVLAGQKDMPPAHAADRMGSLHQCMVQTYALQGVKGEA